MEKTNIRIEPQRCTGCLFCQLVCSLVYTGAFNPEKARIMIEPLKKISFTDECIEGCAVCARYCAFGALERVR